MNYITSISIYLICFIISFLLTISVDEEILESYIIFTRTIFHLKKYNILNQDRNNEITSLTFS